METSMLESRIHGSVVQGLTGLSLGVAFLRKLVAEVF